MRVDDESVRDAALATLTLARTENHTPTYPANAEQNEPNKNEKLVNKANDSL